MKTEYFIDKDGRYLGAFVNGAKPPANAIEVQNPPEDARQRWNGTSWGEPEIPYQEARAAAYPTIGDQLDALWKELNYRRLNGENLVQDADDMLGRILAVKNTYPKGD